MQNRNFQMGFHFASVYTQSPTFNNDKVDVNVTFPKRISEIKTFHT